MTSGDRETHRPANDEPEFDDEDATINMGELALLRRMGLLHPPKTGEDDGETGFHDADADQSLIADADDATLRRSELNARTAPGPLPDADDATIARSKLQALLSAQPETAEPSTAPVAAPTGRSLIQPVREFTAGNGPQAGAARSTTIPAASGTPPRSTAARFADAAPTPRRRLIPKIALPALVVAIAVIGAGLLAWSPWSGDAVATIDRTTAIPADESVAASPADQHTLLVMTTDTSRSTAQVAADGGARSTSAVLVEFSGVRPAVTVVSLPGDLAVPSADSALDAALDSGGMAATVQAVQSLLGLRVDNVALVDRSGFAAFADAVGAVSGGSDGSDEATRTAAALIRGAAENDLLADDRRLNDAVAALAPHIVVDSGLDRARIASLGTRLDAAVVADAVEYLVVPTQAGSDDGTRVLDADAWASVRTSLSSGRTSAEH